MKLEAPTFLLAGAARSGTTALARYLEQHPDIAICQPKEPHYLALRTRGFDFLGPGDDDTINAKSIRTLGDYEQVLARARSSGSIVGDGSVTSLYHWGLVAETLAAEFVGEPRIVVMLRNPVDRAYSSYLYQRQRGFETESFLEGLRLEPERVATGFQHMWHYQRCSEYGPQVTDLVDSVGRDRVGIFIFEEFRRQPVRIAREIAAFVGAEDFEFSDVASVNRSGEPRSFAVASAAAALRRNRLLRGSVRLITTERARSRLVGSLVTHPQLDVELRSELGAGFASDRETVESYLGRPIAEWEI